MPHEAHDCSQCPISPSRRDFLRDASLALAGFAAAFGVNPHALAQLPISVVAGVRRGLHERIYPIPAADGAQIDRKAEVILVRWQGNAYAFNLSCPHQNTALRWDGKSSRFQCPKHHSRYQPDGTFIDGRATRGIDRLAIKIDGTNLVVDDDTMHKQDKNPEAWKAAFVKLP